MSNQRIAHLVVVVVIIGSGAFLLTRPTSNANLDPLPLDGLLSHDFGVVTRDLGEIFSHAFEVTNTSGRVLVVQDVRPSCGCVEVEYDEHPIEPGQVFSLTAAIRVNETRRYEEHISVLFEGEDDPLVFRLSARMRAERSVTLPRHKMILSDSKTFDLIYTDKGDEAPPEIVFEIEDQILTRLRLRPGGWRMIHPSDDRHGRPARWRSLVEMELQDILGDDSLRLQTEAEITQDQIVVRITTDD